MNKSLYVYPSLGKSGLGNLLYVWARAEAFSRLHGLRMIAPTWARFTRIGPWLRGEKYKRFYGADFVPGNYVHGLRKLVLLGTKRKFAERNDSMEDYLSRDGIIVFSGLKGRGDFNSFLDCQPAIKNKLLEIAHPRVLRQVDGASSYIGVHVRRGDFAVGNLVTSDAWFVRAINRALRHEAAKGHSEIRVFSDGYPDELSFIQKAFPDERVRIMGKDPPLADILSLSRSCVMVASPRSTFSAWAVFLGQMPSIWSPQYEVPKMYLEPNANPIIVE